jgi:hypothetical protein
MLPICCTTHAWPMHALAVLFGPVQANMDMCRQTTVCHSAASWATKGLKHGAAAALTDLCVLKAEAQACELCHVDQLREHVLDGPEMACADCHGEALQLGKLCAHAVHHAAGLQWLEVAGQGYRQPIQLWQPASRAAPATGQHTGIKVCCKQSSASNRSAHCQ